MACVLASTATCQPLPLTPCTVNVDGGPCPPVSCDCMIIKHVVLCTVVSSTVAVVYVHLPEVLFVMCKCMSAAVICWAAFGLS